MFGDEPALKPDLWLQAGEFVVTASKDDDHCTISRVPLHGPTVRKTCPLELVKLLHTLSEMGCMYPEVVALLQQADSSGALSCRLRCDALPQATTVFDLVKLGQKKQGQDDSELELVPAGQDLGATPNLFENGPSTSASRTRQQQAMLEDGKKHKEKPDAELPE